MGDLGIDRSVAGHLLKQLDFGSDFTPLHFSPITFTVSPSSAWGKAGQCSVRASPVVTAARAPPCPPGASVQRPASTCALGPRARFRTASPCLLRAQTYFNKTPLQTWWGSVSRLPLSPPRKGEGEVPDGVRIAFPSASSCGCLGSNGQICVS